MDSTYTTTNVVALIIILAGILRVIAGDNASERINETTLTYFVVAAGIFLLPKVLKLKFKDFEIEFSDLKKELSAVKTVANIAKDAYKIGNEQHDSARQYKAITSRFTPKENTNDPWKGVFGGYSSNREQGRRLTAEVQELPDTPGWYAITLTVSRTAPEKEELKDKVHFFIHPTFRNFRPTVTPKNGIATLHLTSYGAFTVGAVTDEGKCVLELDLSELESAPLGFREH